MPALGARVERYTGSRPIFDLHGVEEEIQRSLERKVPLKSGGYLIIDQTEALTTIDVNTGAYVGHRNLEETIYRTNLEAAVAIARQLRLRNLGGIIIIDFIDMEEEEHRRQVLQALEKALAKDHAKTHVSAVSPLGLVEMTRKRTRESLAHQLCAPCPACEGRGFVKTPETVCYEIFREILRQAGQFDFQQLHGARAPGRDRAPARRGVRRARRARGAGRQADPPADRVAVPARPVRRGAHVTAARARWSARLALAGTRGRPADPASRCCSTALRLAIAYVPDNAARIAGLDRAADAHAARVLAGSTRACAGTGPRWCCATCASSTEDGSQALFETREGSVGLDLWNFFRTGELVAGRVRIVGPRVTVVRLADGRIRLLGQRERPADRPPFDLDRLPARARS